MKDAQALEFFQNIKSKTETGKVPWQPTADENEYIASVAGEFSLVFTRRMGQDIYRRDKWFFNLTLKDKENRKLIAANEDVEGISEDALHTFFMAVERHALGVSEKLGRLLDQLDRL